MRVDTGLRLTRHPSTFSRKKTRDHAHLAGVPGVTRSRPKGSPRQVAPLLSTLEFKDTDLDIEWSDDLAAIAKERKEGHRKWRNRMKKALRRTRREIELDAVLEMHGDRMRAGQIATAKALQESLALERAYLDAIGKAMDKKRAAEDEWMADRLAKVAKNAASINRDIVRNKRERLTQRGVVKGRRK
jgi:hypothetical protein